VQLVVGRIGRAHGIKGDVFVDIRTDEPEIRFAAGSVLDTDPAEFGPLTVGSARNHSGRTVVSFVGVPDRTAAEKLRGVRLVIDSDILSPIDDPDEWHDHELAGLTVVDLQGQRLGTVTEIVHGPAGDLLAIGRGDGRESLVPFLREFVPEVDVTAGRIVVAPPAGLLDL
jgi:16S rRNA processing protein RimM